MQASKDTKGLAHIHDFGVNPADGALCAGTPHGVYRFTGDGEHSSDNGETFEMHVRFDATTTYVHR